MMRGAAVREWASGARDDSKSCQLTSFASDLHRYGRESVSIQLTARCHVRQQGQIYFSAVWAGMPLG
jgi:hypothetical protein